jgi:hypothetical protein
MDTALWCGPITHAPSVTAASRNVEVTDDRAIVRWVYMYLREGTVPLEDVDESRAELAEEDVVEEAAEEAAVVLERLERDPLRDVVRRVRHPSLRVLLFLDSSSTMSVVVDRRERAGGRDGNGTMRLLIEAVAVRDGEGKTESAAGMEEGYSDSV